MTGPGPVAMRWAVGGCEIDGRSLGAPVDLELLAPGGTGWEVEVGFGKGMYLRRRARDEPQRRFLGVELVQEYWREVTRKARRDGLANLVTVRGEAGYALDTLLPAAFADALHVYFPDPWPKSRHRKRRLFDDDTVDLPLRVLRPGATLFFATDFVEYGEAVAHLLTQQAGLTVSRHVGPWPDGARTHYESKYLREGRRFVRLTARLEGPSAMARVAPDLLVGPRPTAAANEGAPA